VASGLAHGRAELGEVRGLTTLLPTLIVESVNGKLASPPFCARSVFTAARSSVRSTARMMLVAAVGSGGVKTAEKMATTDCIAVIATVQPPIPPSRRLRPPQTSSRRRSPDQS